MIIFLSVWVSYGQDFLTSPDYVYGYASGTKESEADSLALISFAKSVNVRVSVNTIRSLVESYSGVDELYKSDLCISTNVNVSGVKKLVTLQDDIWTVYYYFNKKKYYEDSISEYNSNLEKAESFNSSSNPHAKNFVLGYLYMAYLSVSNELLGMLYPSVKIIKDDLGERIRERYRTMGYLLSARNVGLTNPSGILLIRDENAKTLPGFEYLNEEGAWVTPKSFCDSDGNDCGKDNAKWAYVYNATREYRFLFELESRFGPVVLKIPDNFYSEYGKRKVFF